MSQDEIVGQKAGHEYIYLAHMERTNWYKIGRSKDPQKRIRRMSDGTLLPSPIVLIAKFKMSDATKTEKFLHETFDHERIHGEWFEFDLDEVGFLIWFFSLPQPVCSFYLDTELRYRMGAFSDEQKREFLFGLTIDYFADVIKTNCWPHIWAAIKAGSIPPAPPSVKIAGLPRKERIVVLPMMHNSG